MPGMTWMPGIGGLAITLLESVLIDPDGGTAADRLSVAWRF